MRISLVDGDRVVGVGERQRAVGPRSTAKSAPATARSARGFPGKSSASGFSAGARQLPHELERLLLFVDVPQKQQGRQDRAAVGEGRSQEVVVECCRRLLARGDRGGKTLLPRRRGGSRGAGGGCSRPPREARRNGRGTASARKASAAWARATPRGRGRPGRARRRGEGALLHQYLRHRVEAAGWKGWQRRRRRSARSEPLRKSVSLDRLAGINRAGRLESAGAAGATARSPSCRNRGPRWPRAPGSSLAASSARESSSRAPRGSPRASSEKVAAAADEPDVDDDLRRRPEEPARLRRKISRRRRRTRLRVTALPRPRCPRRSRCGGPPRPCAQGGKAGGGVRKRAPRRRSTLRIPFVFEGGRRGRRSPGDGRARVHTESFLRPLRRRAEITARPDRVRIRTRKPCVRLRRRLLG